MANRNKQRNRNNQFPKKNNNAKNDIVFAVGTTKKLENIKNRGHLQDTNQEIMRPKIPAELISESDSPQNSTAYNSFYDETTQTIVSFEEALLLIRKREEISEEDNLVYIGKGTFAVIEYVQVEKKQRMLIKKSIVFEKYVEDIQWRDSMRYGLSFPYTPNPQSLSELYTDEEIANFPLNNKK